VPSAFHCRVFKKASPNGKLTVYLGKRDFVDHIDVVDPVGEWGRGDGKGASGVWGGCALCKGTKGG
uniref:Uncharacterized protein n=1 Tax=Pavo cristatus TaxID=9049 RepID=A0A8C9LEJ5_PAVCR